MNILLDFSYVWEFLSGMGIDSFNLYRLFARGDETTPLPLIWDTKGHVNTFIGPLSHKFFSGYVDRLGKLDKGFSMKVATLLQLLYVLVHKMNPYVGYLSYEQKRVLYQRYMTKVLKEDIVDFDTDWLLVSPPANFYYEAVKYFPFRVLDRVFGIYRKSNVTVRSRIDFVLYQYPRFLWFKDAIHIIKIHDLYPLFVKEAVPEGSRTVQTRRFALQKIVSEKWNVFIVTPSQTTQKELFDMFPYFKERTFVVYNNLQQYDLSSIPTRRELFRYLKKRYNINIRFKRYLIQVGTLQPVKGHKFTLTAYNHISRKYRDVGLVFVGGYGWKSKKVYEQINLLVRKGMALHLKDVPTYVLLGLIKYAEALLFPSMAEGFGLPPVEAVMVNTVPIVSDIPVLREVMLNRGALFVKPWNIAEYVKAIEQVLLNKPSIKRNLKQYWNALLKRYADETVYSRWLDVLKELRRNYSTCAS